MVLSSSINLSITQYYCFSIYETTHHHDFSSTLVENLMNLKRAGPLENVFGTLQKWQGPDTVAEEYPHCRALCAGERESHRQAGRDCAAGTKRECWLVITFRGMKWKELTWKKLSLCLCSSDPHSPWPVTSHSFYRCSLGPYKASIPTDTVHCSGTSVWRSLEGWAGQGPVFWSTSEGKG